MKKFQSHRFSHKQKKAAYQALFVLVLFIVVIFIAFTFGFKLLIGMSLFINQLANGKSNNPIEIKRENVIRTLAIDTPMSATNSARVIFSGYVSNFNMIEVYLNKIKIKDIDLVGDNFTEEIQNLEKGENLIYFIAKSKNDKETKKSNEYKIIYKSEKPKLEINDPKDQTSINKPEIRVVGKTDKEIYIRINNLPVVVDVEGNFNTLIKLKEGENKIEIIAEDDAGNAEKKEITVRYNKDD